MRNRNSGEPLFSLRNAGDGSNPELIIYDDIGPSWLGYIGADMVKQRLQGLQSVPEIDVRINSAGGDVFEGFAIYQSLADHPAKINMFIDGMAASISSVIAMAGDRIHIAQQAMFMIHNSRGAVFGEAVDFRKFADLLESINGKISGIYEARTKLSAADLKQAMDEETWIDADQALAEGFADEVLANKQAVEARFDRKFHNFKQFPKDWDPQPLDWEQITSNQAEADKPRAGALREWLDKRDAGQKAA